MIYWRRRSEGKEMNKERDDTTMAGGTTFLGVDTDLYISSRVHTESSFDGMTTKRASLHFVMVGTVRTDAHVTAWEKYH